MSRTAILQEVRQMKFSEYYDRTKARKLSHVEAASLLGMSERSFRRYGKRYEAEGADGLFDRRLARVPQNRVPVDTVSKMLTLFDTQYWDFTPKHFHEKLVENHNFKHSYNWVRLTLQARGRVRKASRRGAHRRKRERRALPGMMLHQDGSSHEWVADQWWDLIVTMDDATSEVYSAFFVEEEGTMSSFAGVGDVIQTKGLFCSLYADRGSHYWHTPEAGGKVDKTNPTQFGRALTQLGIELIPAYSPEARGRSERMFGTLQKRLPQELRLKGITTKEAGHYTPWRFLAHKRTKEEHEGFPAGFLCMVVRWLSITLCGERSCIRVFERQVSDSIFRQVQLPVYVAGKDDVFPAERCQMRDQVMGDFFTILLKRFDRQVEINGVPQGDSEKLVLLVSSDKRDGLSSIILNHFNRPGR